SFTPELDLAAGSAAPVNFQIDQNGHNKVAHGSVTVEKSGAAASLRWLFKAPDWAKSRVLNSTVTMSDNGYKVEMPSTLYSPQVTRMSVAYRPGAASDLGFYRLASS